MQSELPELRFKEFFRDLAIAWRALAAYPPGHPNVAAGLERGIVSLRALLDETGPLELAAARDGLLWGEQLFNAPAPARVAELLRRRGAAVLRIDPGVTPEELERMLRAIAIDSRRARAAGSLAAELAAAGLEHVSATDLDFSAVVLGDLDAAAEGDSSDQIWNRLVRRLLESGALPQDRLESWIDSGRKSADLIRALLSSRGTGREDWMERAVAAVIAAAVADYAAEPGVARLAILSELASLLAPEAREQLARELASALSTRMGGERALADFFATLSAEQREPLRRLLESAQDAMPATPRASDAAHLARLRRAFGALDIDVLDEETAAGVDPALLIELGADGAEATPDRASPELVEELVLAASARSTASVLLELAESEELPAGTRPPLLHRVEQAYRDLLAKGHLGPTLELVERIQRRAGREEDAAADFKRSAERLASRDSIAALALGLADLSESGIDRARALVERLGPNAARHLLGILAESDDRTLRHRLLDLLASLGPMVVRDATHLLTDPRWYVVRNVLLLLRRVGDPGSVPAVRRCAEHDDLRVRLEAIRNLFAFDQELPRELLRDALAHPDPRLAQEAIDLAVEHGMAEAAEPLADLLAHWDPFGRRRDVRLRAIRALATIGDPSVLERLRRFGARFTLLPVAKAERIAFYESLGNYPAESWTAWIVRGKRAPSAEIRLLAAALEARAGAAR